MIKKMYNLTLNEIIKQYKKKSILIITLLILLSAVLAPFLAKALNKPQPNYALNGYKFQIDAINNEISHDYKANAKVAKVQVAILKSQKQVLQLLLDNNISVDNWRFAASNSYSIVLEKIDIINFLQDGFNGETIIQGASYTGRPFDIKDYVSMPKEQWATELKKLESQKIELENNIKNDNYLGYVKENISEIKTTIDMYNKELAILRENYSKNPNDQSIKSNIDALNTKITLSNNLLSVSEYRYNNKIPFEQNNWKNETLKSLEVNMTDLAKPVHSEKEYKSHADSKITYAQYLAKHNNITTNLNNSIKLDWYSLNTNIPQPQYQNSARNTVNSFVGAYVIIITIFILIITGGIVSSEFSKNTIKLLMVRPVSRFKIILSKLLSVLIIGYVILFISLILLTIVSGILFGFSDFGNPILKISSGTVVTQNYLLSLISHSLFYSISMVFITCIAFMLSILTKSTAVSVALSLLTFICATPLALVLLSKNIIWITKTPIPYMCLPTISIIKVLSNMFGSVCILNTSLGAIEIMILSLIFLIIGFVYFIKKDIKL